MRAFPFCGKRKTGLNILMCRVRQTICDIYCMFSGFFCGRVLILSPGVGLCSESTAATGESMFIKAEKDSGQKIVAYNMLTQKIVACNILIQGCILTLYCR